MGVGVGVGGLGAYVSEFKLLVTQHRSVSVQ